MWNHLAMSTAESSVAVRLADESDLAALARLCGQVQDLHATARPDLFQEADDDDLRGYFAGLLAVADSTVWVAVDAGDVCGYAGTREVNRPTSPFRHADRTAEIDQIAVDAELRRSGVGTALVQRALAHARNRGATAVTLNTWAFNTAAHEFFAAMGFAPQSLKLERPLPTRRLTPDQRPA